MTFFEQHPGTQRINKEYFSNNASSASILEKINAKKRTRSKDITEENLNGLLDYIKNNPPPSPATPIKDRALFFNQLILVSLSYAGISRQLLNTSEIGPLSIALLAKMGHSILVATPEKLAAESGTFITLQKNQATIQAFKEGIEQTLKQPACNQPDTFSP